MASVELDDAYYSSNIDKDFRKFLNLNGILYFMNLLLPNGLTSAPRIFTKILKPVFSKLSRRISLSLLFGRLLAHG